MAKWYWVVAVSFFLSLAITFRGRSKVFFTRLFSGETLQSVLDQKGSEIFDYKDVLRKIGKELHSIKPLKVCNKIVFYGPQKKRGSRGERSYGTHALCDRSYKSCGLLSYGVQTEYSFEKLVRQKKGCRVLALDPTVNYRAELYPGLKFLNFAAPMPTQSNSSNDWFTVSPTTIAKLFDKNESLILKMDCEGCEFALYNDIAQKEPNFFNRVDQFAFEVHLPKTRLKLGGVGLRRKQDLIALARLFKTLESAGLNLAHAMITKCWFIDERFGVMQELIDLGYYRKGEGMCQNLLFSKKRTKKQVKI